MDGEWLLELFEMALFMGKFQIGLGFWSQLSVSWLDRCVIARILARNLIFLEYHLWLERRLNLKFKFFKKSKLMTLVTRCTRSSFPVLIPLLRDGSATCSNFTHFSHTNRNFPTHAVTPFQKIKTKKTRPPCNDKIQNNSHLFENWDTTTEECCNLFICLRSPSSDPLSDRIIIGWPRHFLTLSVQGAF